MALVVIRAKILIQSALQRLEWDASLPRADACQWRRFLEELPKFKELRINRWLGTGAEDRAARIRRRVRKRICRCSLPPRRPH